MNRYTSTVLILCVLLGAQAALAVPRAAESTGRHFLIAAQDLGKWHAGLLFRSHKRNIDLFGMRDSLRMEKTGLYVAYDLLPWVAIYGLAGYVEPKLSVIPGEVDRGAEFGGGMWINLIDHDLIDNLALENRIRLQALGQFTVGDPDHFSADLSYTEFHGALTLSIINETIGNKGYWPESVSLFFGPVVDILEGRDYSSRAGTFGAVVGTDVLMSRRVTVSVMYETYDDGSALSGSLNIRF